MKKIIALFLATLMITVMAMSAVVYGAGGSGAEAETVTITVNRDSSYAGSGSGRAFTWYKIFTATYDTSVSDNASGHTSGVANFKDGSGTTGIAYTATAEVAAKLGSWTEGSGSTPGKWEPANDAVKCFVLTPIAGSTNYSVAWNPDVTAEVATLQAAAKWLVANGAYEKSGTMTFADGKWTADVEIGYYVISSDTGDNVIAATTDIEINEKNDYPPIKKEQVDEDLAEKEITEVEEVGTLDGYVGEDDDPVKVAIGDIVNYKVTVTVPMSAKVGETIEVWDKNSVGLTYNDDVVASPATDVTDGTVGTGECWHKIITVTAANKGTSIVFEYTMTINEAALVDVGRENEAGLKYGDNYESLPHSVPYTTYFTGIQKTDGEEPLVGVKFDLFENGEEFPVKLSGSYYIPDPSGSSNEVVTQAPDGTIIIRGIDDDKKYTLTETYTLPGFNMLEEDVELKLVEDASGTFEGYTPDDWTEVVNNQGSVLPSTGGIGTTIFYIVGGLLAVGAGVILVTKKRLGKEDV